MAITPDRSRVLFLPVIRGIYDRSQTKVVRTAVRQAAADLHVDGIFPDDNACTEGLVWQDADVRAYWEMWRTELHDIKALVVFSSDFMWERSVQDTARLLPENVPVFLVVNNDDPGTMVEGGFAGDSLCGQLSAHHNMRMIGRRIVRSACIDMNDRDRLKTTLGTFLNVADGIEALRDMRVGLFGVNPDAFATTFSNQPELFRLGFSLHTYELLSMWGDVVLGRQLNIGTASYEGDIGTIRPANPVYRDDPRVGEAHEQIRASGLLLSTDESIVDTMARCYVWLKAAYERDGLDTGCVHCWPEFARYFGMAPCSFGMLSNYLLHKPLVCEVDIVHAIMARLGAAMTGEPAVILDVNNNGWDPRVFNVFHCSQTPLNWYDDAGAEMTGNWGVQGRIGATPFTAVAGATSHDACHATVFTGQFLSEDPGLRGSSGWAFVPNFPEVLAQMQETGIHHFVAMKGHCPAEVIDALAFRGLHVVSKAVPVPSLEEIEAELPPLPPKGQGSGVCL